MYLTMHLNQEPFQKIKKGTKTVEMRLCDGKRKYIAVGDIIEFINRSDEKDRFETEVIGVHIYPTFKELFENFSKQELGYSDVENADPKDMEKYYSMEEQLKNCVVGIEIKVKK